MELRLAVLELPISGPKVAGAQLPNAYINLFISGLLWAGLTKGATPEQLADLIDLENTPDWL